MLGRRDSWRVGTSGVEARGIAVAARGRTLAPTQEARSGARLTGEEAHQGPTTARSVLAVQEPVRYVSAVRRTAALAQLEARPIPAPWHVSAPMAAASNRMERR